MAMPLPVTDWEDRNLYPLYEEADVPETSLHERVVRYLRGAIAAFARHWFVTGNVCIYRVPGNVEPPVAPDVFVVKEPLPEQDPRVYLVWKDPPICFLAEVASRGTSRLEEGIRLDKYQDRLKVPEHLLYDPERGTLKLRRLGLRGYRDVKPNARGRLRSEQLGLEFALDEHGFPWIYTPDGERLLTHEEAEAERRAAVARAAAEAAARVELERQLAALQAELRKRDLNGSHDR